MIRELAGRVAALSLDELSEAARERLTLCLLANLSVGIAGVGNCVLREPLAGGPFRLLSGGATAQARDAAFWNAAVMHARTQDDFHPVGNLHVGTVILPALLAVADEIQMSGREFLTALAAGYMVAVGLSRGFSPLTSPRGLRSTGIYAPFGATATVARAHGANTERTASALALTTAFAAGTTQAWIDGSDEWQLHPAHAAETGLRSYALAAAGVSGGEHALDGEAGFYNALVGQRPSFAAIAKDFDPSAAIEESVIKRYPVSGICQSVVLACERAARRLPIRRDFVRRVRVEMNPFEMRYPGTLNRGPFRSFGAKLMSATFCAASVITRGAFSFSDFQQGVDPRLERLLGSTEVTEDRDLPLLSATVTVETEDGQSVREQVRNSREEVAIDWTSVDEWASALWEEGGRSASEYESCRDAVRGMATASRLQLPLERSLGIFAVQS